MYSNSTGEKVFSIRIKISHDCTTERVIYRAFPFFFPLFACARGGCAMNFGWVMREFDCPWPPIGAQRVQFAILSCKMVSRKKIDLFKPVYSVSHFTYTQHPGLRHGTARVHYNKRIHITSFIFLRAFLNERGTKRILGSAANSLIVCVYGVNISLISFMSNGWKKKRKIEKRKFNFKSM